MRFDNNKYSVASRAVGRPVEIQAYADQVVIRQDGAIAGEHPRCFGRGETIYDPWHYVPVLAKKPGALRNGAPFKDWPLPASLERVRRKLKGSDDGDRQMVKVLSAVLTDGLAAVEAACAEALADGVHSADVVLNILARQRDPGPAATILTPEALRLRHAPVANCARYDRLAAGYLMERTEILELMSTLKLFGMRAAYDEVMATGIKRRHEPPRIVGDLLSAEVAEKQARSIKYQLSIAKMPLAKDIDDFHFTGTPINEALVRDLASGGFLAEQRNAVLIGGTGTGKSHLAIAIARSCIRGGARGRFYTVVDLVNRLESEARAGRQGRLADYLTRFDFVVLDELGYLPLRPSRRPTAVSPDQPAVRAHLDHRHDQPGLRRMAERLRRRQDDHRAARSANPSLRNHRDRQRELALQKPNLGRPTTPADFNRNDRPTSIGTGGRHQSECPADIIGIRRS